MREIEPIKLRYEKLAEASTDYLIEELSMARFKLEAEFRTKWRGYSHPTIDKAGADLEFGLDWSRIYVQVKGSTLGKRGQWKPNIFDYGKTLNRGFYEGDKVYLGLVLFHCTHEEFEEQRAFGPWTFEATTLMLDGRSVIEFFEQRPKWHSLWIYKAKYERGGYDRLEGAEDIEGIFRAEHEKQEARRKRWSE